VKRHDLRPHGARSHHWKGGSCQHRRQPEQGVETYPSAGRNAGRGGDLYQLTLFIERDFAIGFGTLGLRGEVFNVTNHQNVVGYNGVYGNDPTGKPLATFGQPLGGLANVDPGRQFQFAARLRF